MYNLPTKSLIIASLTLTFIISFFWYLPVFSLQNNLKDITLNNLAVDHQLYQLKQGVVYQNSLPLNWQFNLHQRQRTIQVLKLASFYIWTKEDPLFTSPNLDSQKLAEILPFLDRQQKELLKRYNEAQPIIPIEMLNSIVLVQEQHDNFIKQPSLENANKLFSSYKIFTTSYKTGASAMLSMINKLLNKKNKQANIVYIEIATLPQIIISDYEKILNNAHALENEVTRRNSCLWGKGGCIRPAKFFSFNDTTLPSYPQIKSALLDNDILFYQVYQTRSPSTIVGPYAVPSTCFGLTDSLSSIQQIFYIETYLSKIPYDSSITQLIRLKLATQNYYQKLNPQRYEDRLLIDRGLNWRLVGETNAYRCPDLTYQPKLLTLEKFISDAKNHPLFLLQKDTGLPKIDQLIDKGKGMEENLLSSHIPTYEQMVSLGKFYLYFYSKISFAYMIHPGKLASLYEDKDQFLNMGLQAERLMTHYHLLLTKVATEYFNLDVNERLNNNPESDLFLFLIRNPYSLLYLPSKSFWRSSETLQYIQVKKVVASTGFDNRYLTFDQALTRYKKEEILTWHIGDNILTTTLPRISD